MNITTYVALFLTIVSQAVCPCLAKPSLGTVSMMSGLSLQFYEN